MKIKTPSDKLKEQDSFEQTLRLHLRARLHTQQDGVTIRLSTALAPRPWGNYYMGAYALDANGVRVGGEQFLAVGASSSREAHVGLLLDSLRCVPANCNYLEIVATPSMAAAIESLHTWKRKGWKTRNGAPPKHLRHWIAVESKLEKFQWKVLHEKCWSFDVLRSFLNLKLAAELKICELAAA